MDLSSLSTQFTYVSTNRQLEECVARCRNAKALYFDTEFVSEETYYPDLCLIQVLAGEEVFLIDTHAVDDCKPFWRQLCDGDHLTVVHAGREEFQYCLREGGHRPRRWIDVQIAAGFCGTEFPAAYGKLLSRELGLKLPKAETRTDWRRRPLSDRQLDYAAQDVIHLPDLWERLAERIGRMGRTDWLADELAMWQSSQESAAQSERWRRVSGVSGLGPRAMAIARELWRFRESEAAARDLPPRRLLRDDLLVELARRGTADPHKIKEIRGIRQSRIGGRLDAVSAAIEAGRAVSPGELPRQDRSNSSPQLNATAQFLATALSSICRRQQLAPALVGTVQNVRDLLVYEYDRKNWSCEEPPALSTGWRAEIVGSSLRDLMEGRAVIRVRDPVSDEPLEIVPFQQ